MKNIDRIWVGLMLMAIMSLLTNEPNELWYGLGLILGIMGQLIFIVRIIKSVKDS